MTPLSHLPAFELRRRCFAEASLAPNTRPLTLGRSVVSTLGARRPAARRRRTSPSTPLSTSASQSPAAFRSPRKTGRIDDPAADPPSLPATNGPYSLTKMRSSAGRRRRGFRLDVLPHVPGDGDHVVSVERGNPRARAADRRARVAQDDEALRPDGGHGDRRRDRAHRDLTSLGAPELRRSGFRRRRSSTTSSVPSA